VSTAIATLPPVQRQVILLRDIEGWEADEPLHEPLPGDAPPRTVRRIELRPEHDAGR
jgi:hypothetical protein